MSEARKKERKKDVILTFSGSSLKSTTCFFRLKVIWKKVWRVILPFIGSGWYNAHALKSLEEAYGMVFQKNLVRGPIKCENSKRGSSIFRFYCTFIDRFSEKFPGGSCFITPPYLTPLYSQTSTIGSTILENILFAEKCRIRLGCLILWKYKLIQCWGSSLT